MAKNNNPGRILKGTKTAPSLKSASGVWTLDEALQAHRANSWPQPNLFQPVANTQRFKNASNTYQIRVPNRPGNQTQFTYSVWVKRSLIGGIYNLYTWRSNTGGTYWNILYFNSNDQLQWIDSSGPTVTSTQVFKDTSSWYHIVCVVNTNQSTAANRVVFYVNGVQITSYVSSPTYPTQGQALSINNPTSFAVHFIGTNLSNSQVYDGQMAEINFIDGYALQPTLFGQYDTNNTWVPIPYTGSYGTNGFYLPLTNAITSQTLGFDASLTGAPTYGADQDPYRGSVVLHLTGNGPAGGQNNSFADSSVNNYAVTRTGTATQGSFSPFPLNTNTPYNPAVHGGSYYSGGTGNYITVPSSSNWAIGTTGTVEGWFYVTVSTDLSGVTNKRLWSVTNNSTNLDAYFTGNNIYLHGANVGTVGSNLQINTWYHVAVVYNSGTISIYINGIAQTLTGTTTGYNISGTGTFGLGTLVGASPYEITGYISSFRLIKGAAVYTSNFTPPNRPFGSLTNNLLTFSEQFNPSTYWSSNAAGVSNIEGSAVSPDGNPSATYLKEDTSTGRHRIGYTYTFTNTVTYTASVYAKSTTRHLNINCQSAFSGRAGFDLINGVVGTIQEGTATITNVGNGWYRCSVTGACTSTHSDGLLIQVQLPSDNRDVSYTGDGSSGIYIWGAQLEAASSAGNYVPTPANYSVAPALLLNFANAAIVDSTGATDTITTGNATITSSSKYGSGALVFSNAGASQTDYLNIQNCDCYFAGDFTVEFWFNPQYLSTSWTDFAAILDLSASVNTDFNWWVIHQVNQTLYWATNGGTLTAGNVNVLQTGNVLTTANTWYHVALVRNQTNLSFYINGTLSGTVSSNAAFGSRRALTVGAQNSSSSRFTRGSIDDLRITKGLARYTSNFTPPARALPETGGKSFVTQNVNAGVVQKFTTVGTTTWTAPTDVTQVEVLVVGGGGGGGGSHGGGGGGGGVVYASTYPVTPGQSYTVTVAAGGARTASNAVGNTGGNSQFGNLTAFGGGGGGYEATGGNSGSSGGGGGGKTTGAGSGTAGQGFAGGVGANSVGYGGGGGGGAGAVGTSGTANGNSLGGTGGNGLQFGISGAPTYYAGGGGGAGYTGSGAGTGGSGGLGGGGTGGAYSTSTIGTDGTANTGGGGGGYATNGSPYSGGAGGSGIVIVRYTTATVGNASDTTTDNLVDSPTSYGHDTGAGGEVVGNYATWNPLIGANNQAGSGGTFASSVLTYSNGGLSISNSANAGQAPRMQAHSTIGMTTGKWYAEFTNNTYRGVGISKGDYVQPTGSGSGIDSQVFYYADGSTQVANNANGTITGAGSALSATDVLGIAFDADNATLTWYVNGVSRVVVTGISSSTRPTLPWFFSSSPVGSGSASALTANFGQRPWQYNPPAGFNALTLKNFPRLTIGSAAANPNQYFDVVTYSGTGTQTQTISSLNFQPDLILSKIRTGTTQTTGVFDSVRGITGQALDTGATTAEGTWNSASASQYGYVSAFNSNGFTVTGGSVGTTGGYVNYSGRTYVAWCWKANGAAVSNTAGTITSQVSANVTSGFSIVTYTGTGANGATIGHGLTTTAPSFIIIKSKSNGTNNWFVYHSSLYALNTGNFIYLNANALVQTGGIFFYTAPTTSVFYVGGTGNYVNETGLTYVAYCWSAVPGFSAFGSYTATNTADGPFIYTGFKPRWIMVKITSGATVNSWEIHDTARAPYNTANGANGGAALFIESNEVESARDGFVFTSNGFKAIATGSRSNNPAGTVFIYAAFAQNPFGNVNGTAS